MRVAKNSNKKISSTERNAKSYLDIDLKSMEGGRDLRHILGNSIYITKKTIDERRYNTGRHNNGNYFF